MGFEPQQPKGLEVPTLVSGDLRLRPFREDDHALIEEAAEDPYIPTTTSVPAVPSSQASKAYVERQWTKARESQGYPFVIERPLGAPVGFIGLFLGDIAEGRASVGYWVVPSARGRGTSSLALMTMARWALEVLHIPRLELYIEPWNHASITTAERAAFTQRSLLPGHQTVGNERVDMYLYTRDRDEADPAPKKPKV